MSDADAEVTLEFDGRDDTLLTVDTRDSLEDLARGACTALNLEWCAGGDLTFAVDGAVLEGSESLWDLGVRYGARVEVRVRGEHVARAELARRGVEDMVEYAVAAMQGGDMEAVGLVLASKQLWPADAARVIACAAREGRFAQLDGAELPEGARETAFLVSFVAQDWTACRALAKGLNLLAQLPKLNEDDIYASDEDEEMETLLGQVQAAYGDLLDADASPAAPGDDGGLTPEHVLEIALALANDVREAVSSGIGCLFQYCPADVRADREVVLQAVQDDGLNLEHADPTLRSDREVVLQAVADSGCALEHVCSALRADQEVVLQAAKASAWALQYADPTLCADREFVMQVVKHRGVALACADPALRADREIVLHAVAQDGLSLKYADAALRADRDLVLKAGRLNTWALEHADKALLADKELMLQAVSTDGSALRFADHTLRADGEVVVQAVKQFSNAVSFADPSLLEDADFLQALQEQCPAADSLLMSLKVTTRLRQHSIDNVMMHRD